MKKYLISTFALLTIVTGLLFATTVRADEPDPDTFCPNGPLLGFWSDSNPVYGSESRYFYVPKGSIPETLLDYRFLQRTSDFPLDVTASGLPSGLRIRETFTVYDQPVIDGYSRNSHNFFIAGNARNEGEYEVQLHAESSRCGEDEGTMFLRIADEDTVSCTITNNGPIESGQTANLTWRVRNGDAVRIVPDVPGNPNLFNEETRATEALTRDTTFTLHVEGDNGDDNTCSTKVVVGNIAGNELRFVKTMVEIPNHFNGGAQIIGTGLNFKGKFIFSGDCGVDMSGRSVGGGLWAINEDGTGNVQERDACIDAGSPNNQIYHHAITDDWLTLDGDNGFIRENGSWANCTVAGSGGGGNANEDCAVFGPGANRNVYYDVVNGSVQIRSLSQGGDDPEGTPGYLYGRPTQVRAADGYVVGYWGRGSAMFRSSDWGVVNEDVDVYPQLSYKGYVMDFSGSVQSNNRVMNVYKVSGSNLQKVQTITGIPFTYFSYDYSTNPYQLVIYEPKTRNTNNRRLIWFEDAGNGTGLRQVKEYKLPSSFPDDNPAIIQQAFTTWGDYIVWPLLAQNSVSVWKGGREVDRVKLPLDGAPFQIVGSPSGHIAVSITVSHSDPGRTAVFIYKIGAGATVPPNPTGTTTPPILPTGTGAISFTHDAQGLTTLLSLYTKILEHAFGPKRPAPTSTATSTTSGSFGRDIITPGAATTTGTTSIAELSDAELDLLLWQIFNR